MIKVMFTDGSLGTVKNSRFAKLMRLGKIVAYQPFDTWVEVRRKSNSAGYCGPERRKSNLPAVINY